MPLEEKRKKIDSTDDKILSLLSERLELAKAVGKEKHSSNGPVFVPERESAVLNRLIEKRGKLPAESVKGVFREIIAMCRAAEKPLLVSYLGPKTTFTHAAALKKFGSTVQLSPHDSIATVFNSVEKGNADYGVIPVENSIEGTVSHTLDLFMESDLNIVSEIVMDVMHHLLSNSTLPEIKAIYSHPQALAQCRKWLGKNLPNAELVETSSTARAAELAAKGKDSAAIASELAASEFGLKVVARNLEDAATNVTRFFVIGKERNNASGNDKTSIMFALPHKAGALYKALKPFEERGINMTKIESRPSPTKLWEVVFFIDFEGFAGEEKAKKALDELRKKCLFVKTLGSYPKEVSVSG